MSIRTQSDLFIFFKCDIELTGDYHLVALSKNFRHAIAEDVEVNNSNISGKSYFLKYTLTKVFPH